MTPPVVRPFHDRLRTAILFGDAGVLPVLFVLLVIVLSLTQPYFLGAQNIVNVLRNAAFLIIAASGQMLVLIVGGLDLSIGAVIALTSVDLCQRDGRAARIRRACDSGNHRPGRAGRPGMWLIVGLVNAFCVALLRVPPFMATLGTMSIANGLGCC